MAVDDAEDDQLASMSTEDIIRASRLLDNEIRVHKDELQRTNLELESVKEKIKENQEKIKLNKQLPYLVGNIVEILEMNPEDEAEEDGANIDLDSQRKGKCVVLKTSTRQTIFLPVIGLVDPDKLKPGDLVGVNKDSVQQCVCARIVAVRRVSACVLRGQPVVCVSPARPRRPVRARRSASLRCAPEAGGEGRSGTCFRLL
jgi:ATP-dependent 26S proteasome regulatory subunit